MKYLATIVLIITLGGLTLVKQVEVEAPKTETSNSGEVSLNVQVPDITSATPEVKVTSEPSSTPESTSVVDNVLTAVKKVAIKEGETTTVVVAPAPPTPIVADETTYTPITDFCFNISGNQLDVPSGYSRDQHNNCWPVPVEPTPVEPAPAPTPTPEPEPTPPADTTAPKIIKFAWRQNKTFFLWTNEPINLGSLAIQSSYPEFGAKTTRNVTFTANDIRNPHNSCTRDFCGGYSYAGVSSVSPESFIDCSEGCEHLINLIYYHASVSDLAGNTKTKFSGYRYGQAELDVEER